MKDTALRVAFRQMRWACAWVSLLAAGSTWAQPCSLPLLLARHDDYLTPLDEVLRAQPALEDGGVVTMELYRQLHRIERNAEGRYEYAQPSATQQLDRRVTRWHAGHSAKLPWAARWLSGGISGEAAAPVGRVAAAVGDERIEVPDAGRPPAQTLMAEIELSALRRWAVDHGQRPKLEAALAWADGLPSTPERLERRRDLALAAMASVGFEALPDCRLWQFPPEPPRRPQPLIVDEQVCTALPLDARVRAQLLEWIESQPADRPLHLRLPPFQYPPVPALFERSFPSREVLEQGEWLRRHASTVDAGVAWPDGGVFTLRGRANEPCSWDCCLEHRADLGVGALPLERELGPGPDELERFRTRLYWNPEVRVREDLRPGLPQVPSRAAVELIDLCAREPERVVMSLGRGVVTCGEVIAGWASQWLRDAARSDDCRGGPCEAALRRQLEGHARALGLLALGDELKAAGVARWCAQGLSDDCQQVLRNTLWPLLREKQQPTPAAVAKQLEALKKDPHVCQERRYVVLPDTGACSPGPLEAELSALDAGQRAERLGACDTLERSSTRWTCSVPWRMGTQQTSINDCSAQPREVLQDWFADPGFSALLSEENNCGVQSQTVRWSQPNFTPRMRANPKFGAIARALAIDEAAGVAEAARIADKARAVRFDLPQARVVLESPAVKPDRGSR